MLSKLTGVYARLKPRVPERIVLRVDGFDVYVGDELIANVVWAQIETIVAFKVDLLTEDEIYIEFGVPIRDETVRVGEEAEGFWELVKRVKKELPASRQDWELVVVKPALEQNLTVLYQRDPPQQNSSRDVKAPPL